MVIGRIISVGRKDDYYPDKKNLIGKEVEFNLTATRHQGGGYRRGIFFAAQEMMLEGLLCDKGEAIYFSYVKVKIVEK